MNAPIIDYAAVSIRLDGELLTDLASIVVDVPTTSVPPSLPYEDQAPLVPNDKLWSVEFEFKSGALDVELKKPARLEVDWAAGRYAGDGQLERSGIKARWRGKLAPVEKPS